MILRQLKKDNEAKRSALTKEKGEGVAATQHRLLLPHHTPVRRKSPRRIWKGPTRRPYSTFKEANYPIALKEFEAFLSAYPQSEYADNAQYWIGECYYQQGDYERAILEYDKVIKQYPKGDKVPSALLKEGFAFLDLGDRVNAKLLFNKVMKQYPRSPQAEIAAKKLKVLD